MDSTIDLTQSFLSPWQSGEGASFSPGLTLDDSPQSWRPDEFTLHEGYQEYREELRSLIFNTANSQAPTRHASPDTAGDPHPVAGPDDEVRHQTARILAGEGRVTYLRNYVSQVAPWVSSRSARQSRFAGVSDIYSSICLTATALLGHR